MIDTDQKLTELLPRLEQAPWLAIDTEADSLHAYPEKLCLLQISLPDGDYLVDTLAGFDLSPLLDRLKGRELILHGADYDLRLLQRGLGFCPTIIFDTMWAARLLGYVQFGLTDLVAKNLGIALEKGPQKMNWAQRPLTPRMEAYARNDTHYLRPLAELLRKRLKEKGRLPWQEEVCARVLQDCSQQRISDPDLVWRIKGSDRLGRQALAVLRELWRWREEAAVQKNRPPYFILSHELLVSISAAATLNRPVEPLLPAHYSVKCKARFTAALERALKLPASAHPSLRRSSGVRLGRKEIGRFDSLKLLRDRRAAELQIDPTLIASRSTLVALAVDWEKNQSILMSWQRELFQ
ncbi:MAG: ribonuclease D [Verrucomicrobia bacterium]|nr:ribonuclease D [Verrucomicrobiota bacterium]